MVLFSLPSKVLLVALWPPIKSDIVPSNMPQKGEEEDHPFFLNSKHQIKAITLVIVTPMMRRRVLKEKNKVLKAAAC